MGRNRKYTIKTENGNVRTGTLTFTVHPDDREGHPDDVYIEVPYYGDRGPDGTAGTTVPMDALEEFMRRHRETAPFLEEDVKAVEKLLKRIEEDTTQDTFVVRTDNAFYKELVGMGDKIVCVLLREIDDNAWRKEHPTLYCVSALEDLTGVRPGPREGSDDVQDYCEAWLSWGAEKGLAW